jgi:alkaline phosphatase
VDRFGKGGIGDGIEVVLGGGRAKFLPRSLKDPEDTGSVGARADSRNLVKEWTRKFRGSYVFDQKGFDAIDPARTNHLLGLFERSHMEFEADRKQDAGGEPSLAEMTTKAISILERNPKGYFLMVEAGRIDHGHHAGNAYRALTDAIALSDAVRAALLKTTTGETLLVVTADHSHSFTISGYAKRGNPILGKVVEVGQTAAAKAEDGQPYTTVGYMNGRGFHANVPGEGVYDLPARTGRIPELAQTDSTSPDFHQEALIPLDAETHGGEDVAVYAAGPGSQLVHGVQEESYIFYVMRAALGL